MQHANADIPLWVGRDHNGDNQFGGLVDEVLLFDRALSKAEVDQLYAQKRRFRVEAPAISTGTGPSAQPTVEQPATQMEATFKAGVQTFTFLKAVGGEAQAGFDVTLRPAWPDGQPLHGKTNALGKITFKAPAGNYLVMVNNQALGPIDILSRGKWTSCFIVLPDDFPNPPAGRPELRPGFIDEDLVLTADQVASEGENP